MPARPRFINPIIARPLVKNAVAQRIGGGNDETRMTNDDADDALNEIPE